MLSEKKTRHLCIEIIKHTGTAGKATWSEKSRIDLIWPICSSNDSYTASLLQTYRQEIYFEIDIKLFLFSTGIFLAEMVTIDNIERSAKLGSKLLNRRHINKLETRGL